MKATGRLFGSGPATVPTTPHGQASRPQ